MWSGRKVQDRGLAWSPSTPVSAEPRAESEEQVAVSGRELRLRDLWFTTLLIARLAIVPSASVQAAAWSERLEPVPLIAFGGVIVGLAVARSRLSFTRGLLVGLAIGLALVTVQYAWFQSSEELPRRI